MNALLSSLLSSIGLDADQMMKFAQEAQTRLEGFDARLTTALAGIAEIKAQQSQILELLQGLSNVGSHEGSSAGVNGSAETRIASV